MTSARWFPEDEDDNTLEVDREEINDISPMLPLEVDEEKFVDIQPMALLHGNEEVKKEKWLKTLTPNELLTRLLVLLHIKTGKKFIQTKKRNKKKILYLLYRHNKITKKL